MKVKTEIKAGELSAAQFSMVSNVLKNRTDTAKNSIRNIN